MNSVQWRRTLAALALVLMFCIGESALAQAPAGGQPQSAVAQYRQRAQIIDADIQRFARDHLPQLPPERKAVAQNLVQAKIREAQAFRDMASAQESNNRQRLALARQQQAQAMDRAQLAYQHLKVLEMRDRLEAEVQQLQAERTMAPEGLTQLFDEVVAARQTAAQKYRQAAAVLAQHGQSMESINAIGQAKGAEMESTFKQKAFLLNQQIYQFRQLARQSQGESLKRLVEQFEQVTTDMINESRKELDAQWAIYQLQMKQQLLAAQIEQELQPLEDPQAGPGAAGR